MILFDKGTENKIYTCKEFEELDGFIQEDIAKVTLAKYLYNNLGIACELLLGIKIFPFQEIILRGWFDHNFSMFVASRGASKSWLAAVYCCLYPIFFPESKIVITSNSFRSTRRIIQQVERFINGKQAGLLKQCFVAGTGKLEFQRRSDEFLLEINYGTIIALPLNEKIRGTRASTLFCDEFLSITEDVFKSVLLPFLTAKGDIQGKLNEKEEQEFTKLVDKASNISDEERDMLQANKKLIALTSASYQFEYRYRMFSNWIKKVENQDSISRKYFVVRMSYEALPDELVEKEIVEEAKSGGAETSTFQREFMARFASTSDGYFNIKKLHENTVTPGDLPCVQLRGDKDSKYVVAIDPSTSAALNSDDFAISTFLLNSNERTITQVNTYAKAGGDLKDHIKYLYYVLSSFNVVFITADLGGANMNFIHTCNESSYFMDRGMKLDFIEGNFDAEDYFEQIRIGKHSYNQLEKRITYRQIFTSDWNRKSNEFLQSQIDKNKIKFASPLAGHEAELEKALGIEYGLLFTTKIEQEAKILDFIADQDHAIEETKKQLALIECRASTMGSLQFDLPQHMRRSRSPQKVRRDSYTCVVLAAWAAKVYWDMLYTEEKRNTQLFIPRLF